MALSRLQRQQQSAQALKYPGMQQSAFQPIPLPTSYTVNGVPGVVGGGYTEALSSTPAPAPTSVYDEDMYYEPGNDTTGLTPEQNAFLDNETTSERDSRMAGISANIGKGLTFGAGALLGPAVGTAMDIATTGGNPSSRLGKAAVSVYDSVRSLYGSVFGNSQPTQSQVDAYSQGGPGTFGRSTGGLSGSGSSNVSTNPGDTYGGGGGGGGGGSSEGSAPMGDNAGLGGNSQAFAEGGYVEPQINAPRPQGPGLPTGGPPPAMNPQMIDAKINNLLQNNPQGAQQLQMHIQQAIQSGEVAPEQIQQLGQIAQVVLQNPAMYPQLVKVAEQRGIVPPGELPPQYNEGVVTLILIAARAVAQSPLGQPGQPGQPGGAPIEPMQQMSRGGPIKGPGTGTSDSIPGVNASTGGKVAVSNGEYIIPAKVVSIKGKEFFDNLLRKYADVSGERKEG